MIQEQVYRTKTPISNGKCLALERQVATLTWETVIEGITYDRYFYGREIYGLSFFRALVDAGKVTEIAERKRLGANA